MNVPGVGGFQLGGAGAPTPGQGEIGDLTGGTSGSDLQGYLELMQTTLKQNQLFTLATNIIKMRHDTGKAAINNVRSS